MRNAGARAALVVQLLLQRRLNVQLLLQREKTDYSENKQPSLLAPLAPRVQLLSTKWDL